MINPDTGHYIDPDTGYDIDPDTGKLIDPDTGELIEPDIPSTAGKAGNWKRLFPFCIPWDMMELIKSMQADKKLLCLSLSILLKLSIIPGWLESICPITGSILKYFVGE